MQFAYLLIELENNLNNVLVNNADEPPLQVENVERLLEVVQHFGGKIGNVSLKDKLGWSEEVYWEIRKRAIDSGKLITGRGKGGSVRFPEADKDDVLDSIPSIVDGCDVPVRIPETALYEPVKSVIQNLWSKNANYDDSIVSVTGQKGRAETGGKWTRPDVTLMGLKSYPYVPGRFFDVVTFEVKPIGQTNVEGVFEALSHNQFATKSYVIYHIEVNNDDTGNSIEDLYPRIVNIAQRHGVGVIFATIISDFDTWDEYVPAVRSEVDPSELNRFIATSFSSEEKDKVIKWHK